MPLSTALSGNRQGTVRWLTGARTGGDRRGADNGGRPTHTTHDEKGTDVHAPTSPQPIPPTRPTPARLRHSRPSTGRARQQEHLCHPGGGDGPVAQRPPARVLTGPVTCHASCFPFAGRGRDRYGRSIRDGTEFDRELAADIRAWHFRLARSAEDIVVTVGREAPVAVLQVSGRVKTEVSTRQKLQRQSMKLSQMQDYVGVRITVNGGLNDQIRVVRLLADAFSAAGATSVKVSRRSSMSRTADTVRYTFMSRPLPGGSRPR